MGEELKRRILEALRERPLTMEELVEKLGWEGDRRPLRKVVAELVKEGVIVKVPDYERKKLVFRLAGGRGEV
jgi:DNA-binding transcriptional ArsR family regulator